MTADAPAADPHRVRPAAGGPARKALLRALRVTVAGCLAFYPLRYGFDDSTAALYGLFAVIALGALSEVTGTPAARTRTYLAAVGAGAVLVTAGTLAAVNTVVAATGMLVVGFVVAYAGVGGPRIVGIANGLQLFYILPCFPPFAPDTLDHRIAGLVVGGLLLTAADRLLWPAPGPPPPAERLAVAAEAIAAHATALRAVLRDPAAATGAEEAAREAARNAADALRVAHQPLAQRPLGPGRRDRGLLAAHAAIRVAGGRLADLGRVVGKPGRAPHPLTADLVGAVAETFADLAATLRAGQPVTVPTRDMDAILERYLAVRARHFAEHIAPPDDLRLGLTAVACVEEARVAVLAAGAFLGAPPPDPAVMPPTLWFLRAGRAELVWRRLLAHLTPRSVYLQNAMRVGLGLATARVIAGVFNLSHGFWVLLATLGLMRTSVAAGRAVLPRAFAGTAAGAVIAAALLILVGDDTWIYAWAMPPVMLLGFAAGPVLGVAAGQAGLTIVVAMLFAQVAPTDWRFAEVRIADVVIGGLVGLLIGAAVWPRGGGGEVRRAAAAALQSGAAAVRDTIALLADGTPAPPSDLDRRSFLFDHAYAQSRTEPGEASGPDWLMVLTIVHRMAVYASVLRAQHPAGVAPPAEAAAALRAAAAEVAAAYEAAADEIEAGEPPAPDAGAALRESVNRAGFVLDGRHRRGACAAAGRMGVAAQPGRRPQPVAARLRPASADRGTSSSHLRVAASLRSAVTPGRASAPGGDRPRADAGQDRHAVAQQDRHGRFVDDCGELLAHIRCECGVDDDVPLHHGVPPAVHPHLDLHSARLDVPALEEGPRRHRRAGRQRGREQPDRGHAGHRRPVVGRHVAPHLEPVDVEIDTASGAGGEPPDGPHHRGGHPRHRTGEVGANDFTTMAIGSHTSAPTGSARPRRSAHHRGDVSSAARGRARPSCRGRRGARRTRGGAGRPRLPGTRAR